MDLKLIIFVLFCSELIASTEELPPSCVQLGCPSGQDCITFNGIDQCVDPCQNYTSLNDDWRSVNNTDNSNVHCDYINWQGWYRLFLNQNSAQIPDRCIEANRCGTHAPMWITAPHPTQSDVIVSRTVCNNWAGSCCQFPSHTIQVKLCYGYYVYKLQRPSACHLAYCAEQLFSTKVSGQNETSITLQWSKVNNSVSFVLQFNGTDTNITAPDGNGPVTYTVSSLTAGTKYTFTLFSVFDNIRYSREQLTAVTAPPNAANLHSLRNNETSITLQWSKVNNNVSFVLQFNGTETNISAPDGDGPVTYTVSSLTAGTKYTFTLFSVFENIKSSGVSITAATGPNFVVGLEIELNSLTELSDSDLQDALAELFNLYGILPQISMKVLSVKPGDE